MYSHFWEAGHVRKTKKLHFNIVGPFFGKINCQCDINCCYSILILVFISYSILVISICYSSVCANFFIANFFIAAAVLKYTENNNTIYTLPIKKTNTVEKTQYD